ncbi:hypothetical protein FE257_005629 [Aspergillus nanangensis]|uniref:Zn(2)-C6 fungal-type domain-containing protein n=1 Tax=Aspergillus nanangensis TaxID=2582783 RepID=A0AAD4CQD7_ASPNN|nr:hypothetical protein FE257_005629 [Aspergillus nanangensis]
MASQLVVKPKSCLACRQRKVKCDRVTPCANCARWAIECIFPSPIRRCARPRTTPASSSSPALDHIARLESQIARLSQTIAIQSLRLNLLDEATINYTTSDAMPTLYVRGATAQTCWLTFLARVDPLVKVVHRPSAYQLLLQQTSCTTTPSPLSPSKSALLLAICLASISSMSEPALQSVFAMTKATALSTYRAATHQALMRANFLAASDLTTAQALVLFASFSLYQRHPKSAWSLTGLLRRLFDSSSSSPSSPFDRELHHRLAWQIWYLDHRATGDYHGPSANAALTPPVTTPINCHDHVLTPHMDFPPIPQQCWTAISFSLIRYEIAHARQLVSSPSPQPWATRHDIAAQCQRRIQQRYLAYCDGSEEVHWLARHVAYVLISEMWMGLYRERIGEVAEGVRERLFIAAVDIVDVGRRMEREPLARPWEWLVSGYFQYVPLRFLLEEIVRRWGLGLDYLRLEYAWGVAERAFRRWEGEVSESAHGVVLARLVDEVVALRERGMGMDLGLEGEGISGIWGGEELLPSLLPLE